MTDCFLCNPDPALVITQDDHLQLIAGLGPLTNTYIVIGAVEHVRCFADYTAEHPGVVDSVERVQAWLTNLNGPVLLTEHGRVPMCTTDDEPASATHHSSSDHDSHCYHAHLLAFETSNSITAELSSYFVENERFASLSDALRHAASLDSYILSSPGLGEFHVHSSPIHMPRQLTRSLVAKTLGTPELGNWRAYPNYDQAAATAERMRTGSFATGAGPISASAPTHDAGHAAAPAPGLR